ncbi:alpha-1,4-N-acetylglucosaminyltransferase-like [Mantella aurantiaca]
MAEVYDDPLCTSSAESVIQNLKQGRRPVEECAAEFRTWAADILNRTTQIECFSLRDKSERSWYKVLLTPEAASSPADVLKKNNICRCCSSTFDFAKDYQPLDSTIMRKGLKLFIVVMVIISMAYLSRITREQKSHYIMNILMPNDLLPDSVTTDYASGMSSMIANTILRQGNGILFTETTDRMEPPSLVLCAIESAARVYPDRPVIFFMKGLRNIMTEKDENRTREHFPSLSSFHNIYFLPLRMNELFDHTPLLTWFKKVNPKRERHWTHVSSDACRFALMWKYGGIYMDSDVISIRPIPKENFLAAEHSSSTSSSVFGLSPFHSLSWLFMEDFVQNYRGERWGYQGPKLFTRVVKKLCGMPVFTTTDDIMCADIFYFHPQRFYPISYSSWRRYFEVWQNLPTFNKSYALHLWNYMNTQDKTMIYGSNTLVEHLYQKQCPTTYDYVSKSQL